tara:strand:+ start:735 stop:1103 length:369 start_codon:yes stop_codon:yes gene_type:complete
MALTYRSNKGSALTITELDNNFRHFTGSHSITGSLTVTGDGNFGNINISNITTTGSINIDNGLLNFSLTQSKDFTVEANKSSLLASANINCTGTIEEGGILTMFTEVDIDGDLIISGTFNIV